jgi:hypothetical protein
MNPQTKKMIDDFVRYGYTPGSFIEAVLSNDLCSAFNRADSDNAANLREIVQYVRETVPYGAWRSSDNVRRWIKQGGLKGKDNYAMV